MQMADYALDSMSFGLLIDLLQRTMTRVLLNNAPPRLFMSTLNMFL
jgi:hypothetical protein